VTMADEKHPREVSVSSSATSTIAPSYVVHDLPDDTGEEDLNLLAPWKRAVLPVWALSAVLSPVFSFWASYVQTWLLVDLSDSHHYPLFMMAFFWISLFVNSFSTGK
jgi:hypothetical protein